MNRKVYAPKELEAILGISRWSVYKLLRENKIPNIRLNGRIIIPKKPFDRFLDGCREDICG